MRKDIYTPPQGPPAQGAPRIFDRVGMESLYKLAWAHYQLLGASAIGHLFPDNPEELLQASRKQAEFWSGVTGGPPVYARKHGPPRMRARHFPFEIDEAARREWMRCMREALGDGAEWGFTDGDVTAWLAWLEGFSGWMVNKQRETEAG